MKLRHSCFTKSGWGTLLLKNAKNKLAFCSWQLSLQLFAVPFLRWSTGRGSVLLKCTTLHIPFCFVICATINGRRKKMKWANIAGSPISSSCHLGSNIRWRRKCNVWKVSGQYSGWRGVFDSPRWHGSWWVQAIGDHNSLWTSFSPHAHSFVQWIAQDLLSVPQSLWASLKG